MNKRIAEALVECGYADRVSIKHEDWLKDDEADLWIQSYWNAKDKSTCHQWRLDRIKWCFEQLAEKDDEQP